MLIMHRLRATEFFRGLCGAGWHPAKTMSYGVSIDVECASYNTKYTPVGTLQHTFYSIWYTAVHSVNQLANRSTHNC